MKKSSVKIYIATHKIFNTPKQSEYIPLHVGKKGKNDLGYIGDDTGDNISKKNPNYCELTGLYWIWKNSKEDIVGLVHYRRFFYNNSVVNNKENVLTKEEIEKILNKYDLIVPNKNYTCFLTVKEQFEKFHIKEDLLVCKEVIEKKYPEYMDSFNIVMNKKSFYSFNMLITKKEIFDKYCNWLFSILFEVERKVDLSNREGYNSRIFGFLSERLFNVWLEKNQYLKIKEKYVYNTEENYLKQRIISIIKKVLFWSR